MMEPLEITAELGGRLILPHEGYIHIDALLAWAVTVRDDYALALDEEQLRPVEIPVQRSACGRYHMASASVCDVRLREKRYIHQRFPVEHWQSLGGGKSVNRIQINAGPSKGFRVPVEAQHLEGRLLTWWCIGERDEITELLALVTHVGRRRAVGEGEVREWRVEPCESWGEGFPVMRDGAPLRHLPDKPIDGPHMLRIGNISYPYWRRSTEELIIAPRQTR